MFAHYTKPTLGLAILVLFSINISFSYSSYKIGVPFSPLLSSRVFSLLPAPIIQDTSYPPPSTQGPTTGYPAQNTSTESSGYPGPATNTPVTLVTQPPGLKQTQPGQTLTVSSGTQPIPPTTEEDIFLTENAEMGQSRATHLPTETPSPSPTVTITATLLPLSPTISPDQGFVMNWGAFIMGFFGMLILGGVAWFMFTRRVLFSKD